MVAALSPVLPCTLISFRFNLSAPEGQFLKSLDGQERRAVTGGTPQKLPPDDSPAILCTLNGSTLDLILILATPVYTL